MIRFLYFAIAALMVAVCIEQTLAQSLSPLVSDNSASSRFESRAAANIKNPPPPPRNPVRCQYQRAQDPQGLHGTQPQQKGSITLLPDGSTHITQQTDDKGSRMPMQSQQLDCARN